MGKYKNPVCRGCWSLGNNCGHCERCIETKPSKKKESAAGDLIHELYFSLKDMLRAYDNAAENDDAACFVGWRSKCEHRAKAAVKRYETEQT